MRLFIHVWSYQFPYIIHIRIYEWEREKRERRERKRERKRRGLFNTTWHHTDAWYQIYMTVLMYYSVLTWYQLLICMLGDLCYDNFWSLTQRPPWWDNKDSTTNEKCWHHFRILIVDKWSVVWNECKNREFQFTGWKSLWSLATWLVISDRYTGEVILQLSVEAMASHSKSIKPLPQLRAEYILLVPSSSTTHYIWVPF